jgi:hypothetical protein
MQFEQFLWLGIWVTSIDSVISVRAGANGERNKLFEQQKLESVHDST